MLTDPAKQHILSLSDDALVLYVVAGPELYDPDAVAFARQELARRQLPPERVAELEQRAGARVDAWKEAQAEEATKPLDFWDRVNALLWGMHGIAFFWQWVSYDDAGQRRRARELLKYGCLGTILIYGFIALCLWLVHRR
jgi:hypothetical protein